MKLSEGDQVIGLGRNGRPWPTHPKGTVTATTDSSVLVSWHDTCVEDEMAFAEVELAPLPV